MYLTISKRFELSSSARLYNPKRDDKTNFATYGPASRGIYGHGYNYVAGFIFHGPVDDQTGMMLNISLIKKRIIELIESRYDHRFLNLDTPPFTEIVPTPENLARQLLSDASPLFEDQPARPVACHFCDTNQSGAIAYADGRIERIFGLEFSAARRTYSPHLSEKENHDLFGPSAALSGHGHNYRLIVTLGGEFDSDTGVVVPYHEHQSALSSLQRELDHKNLNLDVPGLAGLPITTESMARYIRQKLRQTLPVVRVRLDERHDFFAEYAGDDQFRLGAVRSIHAAHRLFSATLTDEENRITYGKCNNRNGHGHEYRVEATVDGAYDERSGTLYDFVALTGGLDKALNRWAYKRLDLECDEFADIPSTGENIVAKLWPRLDSALNNQLYRARLWETPNNRFTLRRSL